MDDKKKKKGDWKEALTKLGQGVAQYGSDMGAVKAGMAGVPTKAKKLKFAKSVKKAASSKEEFDKDKEGKVEKLELRPLNYPLDDKDDKLEAKKAALKKLRSGSYKKD